MPVYPQILFSAPDSDGWLCFPPPKKIFTARRADEVSDVISAAQNAGAFAAGFAAYEAAPAFDSAHRTRAAPPPLAWFAVADTPPQPALLPPPSAHFCGRWRAAIRKTEYCNAVREIQRQITKGNVYQVNFTYPLRARFAGSPLSFFAALCARQPSPWRFFAETENWAVCSASPECFFERRGETLKSRPMKGTRPASPRAAAQLAASRKDRAENLMIVDMLRNDMSRIGDARRVRAEALLEIEEYPTVAQMTSTVACESAAPLADIFAALFPCASVTGAPKIAAMNIIAALEKTPRRVYCGACGWAGGEGARFNVAIRTAFVDKKEGRAEYGIGSGIVADSSASAEWRECQSKAEILIPSAPPFLMETMRAEKSGVALLSRHLARLAKSARYFGIPFRPKNAAALTRETCEKLSAPSVLRLYLPANGKLRAECRPLPPAKKTPRAILSAAPVRAENILLRHKTSQRENYETALAEASKRGFDDAILQNERGEITETCIANIAAKINGKWQTPPVNCGLLPGVQRAALLAQKTISEKILTAADLQTAEKICRLNAVRGMEEIAVSFSEK
ncbi:MAG: chorismate-binding protein [Gammaproteobacteria bacterium]